MNNLKQLSVAARIWALDHNDVLPPDVVSMTNELGNDMKILMCPSDPNQTVYNEGANNLHFAVPGYCSYQYVAASCTNIDPEQVVFICPFHGSLAFGDGSVQVAPAILQHPEWLVKRDGKIYFKKPKSNPGQP